LIVKKRRSAVEVDAMIGMAHASRYHWSVVGGSQELAVGEWQISHVYAVLDRPEPSLYHAQRCLEICQASKLGDFALAYAYEALARAFALAGKARPREACLKLAKGAGAKIADADERAQFLRDLRTVPRTTALRTAPSFGTRRASRTRQIPAVPSHCGSARTMSSR